MTEPCGLCGRTYPHIHGMGLYPKKDDCMKSDPELVIAEIESVREKNNRSWMEILRLAVKYAPADEVKETLQEIMRRDKQVHEACQRLLNQL